jgi:hypothetical protein
VETFVEGEDEDERDDLRISGLTVSGRRKGERQLHFQVPTISMS